MRIGVLGRAARAGGGAAAGGAGVSSIIGAGAGKAAGTVLVIAFASASRRCASRLSASRRCSASRRSASRRCASIVSSCFACRSTERNISHPARVDTSMVRFGAAYGPFSVTKISGLIVLEPSAMTGPDKVRRVSIDASARSALADSATSAPWPSTIVCAIRACPALTVTAASSRGTARRPPSSTVATMSPIRGASMACP